MNKEATCPYCGYEEGDSWEIHCGNGETIEWECDNCDRTYLLTRDVETTYTSEKLRSDKE